MFRTAELGKEYADGEIIVAQGDPGSCMFIVQNGEVEVMAQDDNDPDNRVSLVVLKAGDIFGEMALFNKAPRSATVRAKGEARVLTVDRRGFMKRVHQDPSLGYRILGKLSERVRTLDQEVLRLRNKLKQAGVDPD